MTTAFRSSGHLLADRRYAYAAGAMDEGDPAAAADLARQVLELAPDFAPAHALLGRAQAALGDREGAAAALRQALALEPEDGLGVGVDLARLGAHDHAAAMSGAYVRTLFDGYADRFERHLTENLGYRGPALLREAVARVAPGRGFRRMLDLGCGTGLGARAFADLCERIAGVDISPRMVAQAERTGLYDRLVAGDLVSFLQDESEGAADLVLAADVLIYVGALDALFTTAARVLAAQGLFAFTVQRAADAPAGFAIGEDRRFAYAEAYLRKQAAAAGFEVCLIEPTSTRRDRGADVPELAVVLRR